MQKLSKAEITVVQKCSDYVGQKMIVFTFLCSTHHRTEDKKLNRILKCRTNFQILDVLLIEVAFAYRRIFARGVTMHASLSE